MINPRSLYTQFLDNNSDTTSHSDYFNPSGLKEVFADKKKLQKLYVVKQGLSKDGPLNQAYTSFKNINQRLIIDSMLFFFTKEDIATLPGISIEFLNAYTDYFFSLDDFDNISHRNSFLARINTPAAKAWYSSLSCRTFKDVKFRLTGRYEQKIDLQASLKDMYAKTYNMFNTFSTTDPQKLKEFADTGMFKGDKTVYDVAFKALAGAVKLADMIIKNDSDDKEDFLASWGIEVETVDGDFFDAEQNELIEADLLELMAEVNPVSDSASTLMNFDDVAPSD